MTNNEFKAWFNGFCENLSTAPTKAQWDKVKARVKELDGSPTSQTVFIDRYIKDAYPKWYFTETPTRFFSSQMGSAVGVNQTSIFNSEDSMNLLGIKDFQSTTA